MNPVPRWANWLAAVAIFAGYAVLEWQDAEIERRIAQAERTNITAHNQGPNQ